MQLQVYCIGQDQCVQSWEVDDFDTDCAPGAAKRRRMPTVETAWSHAMDKNCCGGGEACGYVRSLLAAVHCLSSLGKVMFRNLC